MAKKILFKNAEQILTNAGVVVKGGVDIKESDLGIIANGSLLWDSAKGIVWVGRRDEKVPAKLSSGAKTINLKGKILTPAFVDCHTHLVFGGTRHAELAMRLDGKTYQDIAASGGGIRVSVDATRAATEAELFRLAKERVETLTSTGVGVIEMKSGYGLDWPTERKQLKVAQKIKRAFPELVFQSTFLGAHDFPREARTPKEKDAYVEEILKKMLPTVAKEKLADACDVFFDVGYYSESQARKILTHAKKLGLKIKLHADELENTGGARLAAELGALSADHLLKADEANLAKMAKAGVVAVLLPGTAFFLKLPYASLEKMRKAKVCMALSTDFNPGSSPTLNFPLILQLACLQMGMTMPEAFAAGTYGGARALGMHEQHGSIQSGHKPKLAVFRVQDYRQLISNYGHPGLCEMVI